MLSVALGYEYMKKRNQHNHNPELQGKTFGFLTLIKWEGMKQFRNQCYSSWLCQCHCGKHKIIRESNILTGVSRSCGCLRKEKCALVHTTHGLSRKPIYRIWAHLIQNKQVTKAWKKFDSFYEDVKNSFSGNDVYLYRLDINKPYGKDNFYWSDTIKWEKPKHTYDIDGKMYTRKEISDLLKVSRQRVEQLDKQGYLIGRVLMALDPL